MYPLALHRGLKRRQIWFWVLTLGLLLVIFWVSGRYGYEYFSRGGDYDGIIEAAARRHGIDGRLLRAVIWQESRFDRDSRGRKGEVGLMQIMPGDGGAVKDWTGHHQVDLRCDGLLFNPVLNVEIGAWYLARALRRWSEYDGRVELALCEYNAGPSRARLWKPVTYDGKVFDRIGYRSTQGYVRSIMDKYAEYCHVPEE